MILQAERSRLIAMARQGALSPEDQRRLADELEAQVAESVALVGHIHRIVKRLEEAES
jgi:predicted transcriptional regulator